MQNLEKRIATLEQADQSDQGMVMFINFDTPGEPPPEIRKLRSSLDADCQRWVQEPNESPDALRARVKREVKRSPWGSALVFQDD